MREYEGEGRRENFGLPRMRLVLLIVAALAMLVALAAGVAAVLMPAAIFIQFPLGRYSLCVNRSVVEFCEGSEIRAWAPLVAIALVMGLPSTIYLGHAVLSLMARRKDCRGFNVTPTPPPALPESDDRQ